jgi:hypothetical protein
MNCTDCKDEYCHVCQIGVDPIGWIELLPEDWVIGEIVASWERYTQPIFLRALNDSDEIIRNNNLTIDTESNE